MRRRRDGRNRAGHDVSGARRQPSLILLDLQMPGMDGIEALRYMGRQGVTSGILLASGMDQRVLASARPDISA